MVGNIGCLFNAYVVNKGITSYSVVVQIGMLIGKR